MFMSVKKITGSGPDLNTFTQEDRMQILKRKIDCAVSSVIYQLMTSLSYVKPISIDTST